MEIIENGVIIENIVVKMDMDYETVMKLLEDYIYIKDSCGYIVIKKQEFYGLKGTCTIYFQENGIRLISIEIDWSMNKLVDEHGDLINIDEAIKIIAQTSIDELTQNMGEAIEEYKFGNKVFKSKGLYIITSIVKTGDMYSVIVRKA